MATPSQPPPTPEKPSPPIDEPWWPLKALASTARRTSLIFVAVAALWHGAFHYYRVGLSNRSVRPELLFIEDAVFVLCSGLFLYLLLRIHLRNFSREITARQESQLTLRETERRLHLAMEAGGVGAWEWDLVTNRCHWSPIHEQMLGFAPGEFGGTFDEFDSRVHPEDRAGLVAAVRDSQSRKGTYDHEFRVIWPDQSLHWVTAMGETVFDSAGQPQKMFGVIREITQRKKNQLAIETQRRFLHDLVENSNAVIFAKDLHYRYHLINRKWEEVTGQSREKALGRADAELFSQEAAERYRTVDAQVVEAGEAVIVEETVTDRTTVRTFLSSRFPVRDGLGQITGVCGIATDITALKQAEEELRISRARLNEAQRIARLGNWELDLKTDRLLWSDEIFRIFEIDPEQFDASYEAFLAAIHPDDREEVNRSYLQSLEARMPFEITHRLLMPDGRIKFIHQRGETLYSAAGHPLRSLGTVQDVTAQEQARLTLANREAILQQIIGQAVDSIALIDAETGKFVEFNESAHRALGYTREEFAQLTVPDIDAVQDRDEIHAHFAHMSEPTGRVIESQHRTRTGEIRDVRISARSVVIDGRGYLVALWSDITNQRRAEAHLRKLSRAIEQSPASIVITDLSGAIEYVNPRFCQLTGYSAEEVIGQTPRVTKSGLMPKSIYDELWKTITSGQVWRGEIVNRKKNGEHFTELVVVTPVQDEFGRPTHFVGLKEDITARKATEQRVQDQLARTALLNQITRKIGERTDLKTILQIVAATLEEYMPAAFVALCLTGVEHGAVEITAFGPASEALADSADLDSGSRLVIASEGLECCASGAVVERPNLNDSASPLATILVRAGLAAAAMAPLALNDQVFGLLLTARRKACSFSAEDCEFLRQLGEQVALAVHQVRLLSDLQNANAELRASREAALQQERLRALGQMASGVAHDINNAISPVSIYCDLLQQMEPNLGDEAKDFLKTIQHSIQDVAGIVARLREFYRQRDQQTELFPVLLNHVAKEVVKLTRARWVDMPQERGIVIDMDLQLAEALPEVLGIETEIREALINLVFNAVDAMPNGGKLTLRTGLTTEMPPRVFIEARDSGVGMDEDTRRRCLDPFFTTKGERGTGLGLAMVSGIALRHEAEISIASAPNEGTTIRLTFPVPKEALLKRAPVDATVTVPSMKVLVVDDDPLISRALDFGLQVDGHTVLTAEGGSEGIARFQEALAQGAPFDAVITDLGMPHVDGRKVAAAVKSAAPQTPLILLTGWGQRLIDAGDIPAHVDLVLSKPPRLGEIREALAACHAGTLHEHKQSARKLADR